MHPLHAAPTLLPQSLHGGISTGESFRANPLIQSIHNVVCSRFLLDLRSPLLHVAVISPLLHNLLSIMYWAYPNVHFLVKSSKGKTLALLLLNGIDGRAAARMRGSVR